MKIFFEKSSMKPYEENNLNLSKRALWSPMKKNIFKFRQIHQISQIPPNFVKSAKFRKIRQISQNPPNFANSPKIS